MVYCFDLDGTLCNTDGNNYKDSTPKKERIEIVNTLYDEGHTILIDTARGCVSGKNYFFFTMEQLKSWGVKFHTLRTGVKFGADVFIDDKGIQDQRFFKV
jgi:hydroxymethylpyrimidine pyrophosphatase-like HAD family hydrolase